MKKRLIIYIMALLLISMLVATPIFAHDGDADAHVDPNSVIVTENPNGSVTVSGTVETEAEADASRSGHISYTEAETSAWYSINGVVTIIGTTSDSDSGSHPSSDSSCDYSWNKTLTLPGDYSVRQGGTAYAEWYNAHDSGHDNDSHQSALAIFKIKPLPPKPVTPLGWEWGPALNKFSIWCGGVYSYNWSDGHSTLPAINLTTTAWWNGTQTTLKFVIQEGTVVTGDYCLRAVAAPGGVQLSTLNGGKMTFSSPVVISKLVDGKWIEVASITSL